MVEMGFRSGNWADLRGFDGLEWWLRCIGMKMRMDMTKNHYFENESIEVRQHLMRVCGNSNF